MQLRCCNFFCTQQWIGTHGEWLCVLLVTALTPALCSQGDPFSLEWMPVPKDAPQPQPQDALPYVMFTEEGTDEAPFLIENHEPNRRWVRNPCPHTSTLSFAPFCAPAVRLARFLRRWLSAEQLRPLE